MAKNSIERILHKAKANVELDFEGSYTYRIHVKVAESLIKEAYRLGLEEGKDGKG